MEKVISKADFIAIDPNCILIRAVDYDKKLLGVTNYNFEIAID
jgi:hypothetical protein